MARKNQMTDDDTLHHLVSLPLDGAGLPYHLPDGPLGLGEVVRSAGETLSQPGFRVFQIR